MSRERVQGVVLGNELSRDRCRGDWPSHWTRCVVPTRSLLWTQSATPSYGPAGAGRREDDSDHQEPDADRRDEKREVRHHGGHGEARGSQENVRDEHQAQCGRAASDEILSHPPPFRRIRGSGLNGLPQTRPRLATEDMRPEKDSAPNGISTQVGVLLCASCFRQILLRALRVPRKTLHLPGLIRRVRASLPVTTSRAGKHNSVVAYSATG